MGKIPPKPPTGGLEECMMVVFILAPSLEGGRGGCFN